MVASIERVLGAIHSIDVDGVCIKQQDEVNEKRDSVLKTLIPVASPSVAFVLDM